MKTTFYILSVATRALTYVYVKAREIQTRSADKNCNPAVSIPCPLRSRRGYVEAGSLKAATSATLRMTAVEARAKSANPGSSSFITDATGTAIQHLEYLPYGELWVNQQSGSFDSRYKFSAKEKDAETSYSYFGARYYDSDLSVWLSVDPLSDKYPSLSPYAYCANNPVILKDPNGMSIEGGGDENIDELINKRSVIRKMDKFDRMVEREMNNGATPEDARANVYSQNADAKWIRVKNKDRKYSHNSGNRFYAMGDLIDYKNHKEETESTPPNINGQISGNNTNGAGVPSYTNSLPAGCTGTVTVSNGSSTSYTAPNTVTVTIGGVSTTGNFQNPGDFLPVPFNTTSSTPLSISVTVDPANQANVNSARGIVQSMGGIYNINISYTANNNKTAFTPKVYFSVGSFGDLVRAGKVK